MKNLVVGGVVLLLALLGPQQYLHSRYDALWALGALVLVSYILERALHPVGVPPQAAWLAAGLLLGASGRGLLRPDEIGTPQLVWGLAGVWVGFQVGVHLAWGTLPRWRTTALAGLATLATLGATTAGLALVTQAPWWVTLLLGALASLWGPFTLLPGPGRRHITTLGLVGAGFGLLFLACVLLLLQTHGVLPPAAALLVLRLCVSVALGAASAEILCRFGLFALHASTLGAGLLFSFLALALLVQQVPLFGLPCGLGAGAVLVLHGTPAKRMRLLLRPVTPAAFLVYFALTGAMVDLRVFAPPSPDLAWLVLVQVGVLVLVRGFGPAVWSPL
ncbi:MAG: hypothetical protein AB1505_28215, partial [Candidatus Latescibacterota bacterium]